MEKFSYICYKFILLYSSWKLAFLSFWWEANINVNFFFSGWIFLLLILPILCSIIFIFVIGADMKDLHLAIVNEEASCENFTLSRSLIPEKYGRCHMENLGCIFSDFIENEPLFLNVCIFFVKKNFRFIIISSLIWDDLFFILDYVPRCLRVCRIFSKYFFHYIPPLYPSIKIKLESKLYIFWFEIIFLSYF